VLEPGHNLLTFYLFGEAAGMVKAEEVAAEAPEVVDGKAAYYL
jgi:hypothetical protein